MRGSREISLVPSLHRASTDALIIINPDFSTKSYFTIRVYNYNDDIHLEVDI